MRPKRTAQLNPRLTKVASMVRPHAVFADIGCDHGHLAIELMRRGAVRGYACDINEKPLQNAKANIAAAGFSQQIQTVLTDGLQHLEHSGITDVTIAGIGGEVITEILRQAQFLKDPAIRLILQPQSREYILRTFLMENGFSLLQEEAVRSDRYVYTVITAEYTGKTQSLTMLQAFSGLLAENHTPEAAEKLSKTAQFLKNTAKGVAKSGNQIQADRMQQTAEQLSQISTQILTGFPG